LVTDIKRPTRRSLSRLLTPDRETFDINVNKPQNLAKFVLTSAVRSQKKNTNTHGRNTPNHTDLNTPERSSRAKSNRIISSTPAKNKGLKMKTQLDKIKNTDLRKASPLRESNVNRHVSFADDRKFDSFPNLSLNPVLPADSNEMVLTNEDLLNTPTKAYFATTNNGNPMVSSASENGLFGFGQDSIKRLSMSIPNISISLPSTPARVRACSGDSGTKNKVVNKNKRVRSNSASMAETISRQMTEDEYIK